jgi:hypothetical protein
MYIDVHELVKLKADVTAFLQDTLEQHIGV